MHLLPPKGRNSPRAVQSVTWRSITAHVYTSVLVSWVTDDESYPSEHQHSGFALTPGVWVLVVGVCSAFLPRGWHRATSACFSVKRKMQAQWLTEYCIKKQSLCACESGLRAHCRGGIVRRTDESNWHQVLGSQSPDRLVAVGTRAALRLSPTCCFFGSTQLGAGFSDPDVCGSGMGVFRVRRWRLFRSFESHIEWYISLSHHLSNNSSKQVI